MCKSKAEYLVPFVEVVIFARFVSSIYTDRNNDQYDQQR